MNPKIVINLQGRSCSGKSTLQSALAERLPGAYHVSYDKLKWQLAGYRRDQDRDLVKRLLFGFFEMVCKEGLAIILEGGIRNADDYHAYRSAAEAHGYRFLDVQTTAATEVLIERFRARMADVKRDPSRRVSVADEETYRKNLAAELFVAEGTKTFDSSVTGAREMADWIMGEITKT